MQTNFERLFPFSSGADLDAHANRDGDFPLLMRIVFFSLRVKF